MSPGSAVLDHVAIGVRAIADAVPFVVGELGGLPFEGGPNPGFRWAQWKFAGGGCLELIEPSGPREDFLHRFLAKHGPGVHHVTFKVPDLAAATAHARAQGYDIVGEDLRHPAWKEAFLHPKQAQGIVVQLAESNPELEDHSGPAWQPPPGPTPAEPATLVGLRLAAASAADARRQWEETLGGACTEREHDLVFRWPDSPLAVLVVPSPRARPGPLWLEVAAPRPLALPEGPEPVLGTSFVQVPA